MRTKMMIALALVASLVSVAMPVEASGASVCTNVNGCTWAWYGPTFVGCRQVYVQVPQNLSLTVCV